MKSLEEMCSSLKLRSDEVNQECKELRESVELKKKEVEKTTADIMELKRKNIILETEKQELQTLYKHKRKKINIDSIENVQKYEEMEVDDEDQIVDEIIKIKNFVFKERMTSKKISDCNLKIDNFKQFIKSNKNLLQHYEKLAMTLKLTHSAL